MLYFLQSTSVLSFDIDVVLTLSIHDKHKHVNLVPCQILEWFVNLSVSVKNGAMYTGIISSEKIG